VCAKNHPDRLSRLATIHQRYRRTDGRTDFLWHRPDLTVGQKSVLIFVCCSELTDISLLASYVHLRYVDLSGNNLRDVSALNSLSHLLAIQLSNNKLTNADVPTNLPYLQTASFAGNRIQSLAGIYHPVLESLNLNCKMALIYNIDTLWLYAKLYTVATYIIMLNVFMIVILYLRML